MRHVPKAKGFSLHWALMDYLYDALQSIHWASVLFDRKTQQFGFALQLRVPQVVAQIMCLIFGFRLILRALRFILACLPVRC